MIYLTQDEVQILLETGIKVWLTSDPEPPDFVPIAILSGTDIESVSRLAITEAIKLAPDRTDGVKSYYLKTPTKTFIVAADVKWDPLLVDFSIELVP